MCLSTCSPILQSVDSFFFVQRLSARPQSQNHCQVWMINWFLWIVSGYVTPVWPNAFIEMIFLPLIQVGQLSVTDIIMHTLTGVQWLSGRVLDMRSRGPGSSLTGITWLCPWARHIYPSLVLVQPRKTNPYIAERLLMRCKNSNQTNKNA